MTAKSDSRMHAAFIALFEEHYDRLHRYLNRLSGDSELASELAQEAFIRLYRRGSLPDDSEAWLFTVGTNLFRNAKSKRARRRRLLTAHRSRNVLSDPPPAPDHAHEAVESRRRVREAIDYLPERDRALLLLRSEGYSYREMAGILEMNETSVGTLLRRAKQAFRTALEEDSHAP